MNGSKWYRGAEVDTVMSWWRSTLLCWRFVPALAIRDNDALLFVPSLWRIKKHISSFSPVEMLIAPLITKPFLKEHLNNATLSFFNKWKSTSNSSKLWQSLVRLKQTINGLTPLYINKYHVQCQQNRFNKNMNLCIYVFYLHRISKMYIYSHIKMYFNNCNFEFYIHTYR